MKRLNYFFINIIVFVITLVYLAWHDNKLSFLFE